MTNPETTVRPNRLARLLAAAALTACSAEDPDAFPDAGDEAPEPPPPEPATDHVPIDSTALTHDGTPEIGVQRWALVPCIYPERINDAKTPVYQIWSVAANLRPYWSEASYGLLEIQDLLPRASYYVLPWTEADYAVRYPADPVGAAQFDCARSVTGLVNVDTITGFLLFVHDARSDRSSATGAAGACWDLKGTGAIRCYKVATIVKSQFLDWGTWAHEMGHTFDFGHSEGPYGEPYDSMWDIMSDTWYRSHPRAWVKWISAGWIPASRRFGAGPATVATVQLERLAQPGPNGYLFAEVPVADGSAPYVIEARRQAGYDSSVLEGVIIQKPHWMVMDGDGNGETNDDGSVWTVGERFVDEARDVRISVLGDTGTGYRVGIENVRYRTDVRVTGAAGTVTGGGVSCSVACRYRFWPLEPTLLYANPGPGNLLKRWIGCDSVNGNTCSFRATTNRSVTAEMCTPPTYQACFEACMADGDGYNTCSTRCRAESTQC